MVSHLRSLFTKEASSRKTCIRIAASAVLALIFLSITVSASVNITECSELNIPDTVYQFYGFHDTTARFSCFNITADNVTLEYLGGDFLTLGETGQSRSTNAIYVNASHATILSVHTSGARVGIFFENSFYNNVTDFVMYNYGAYDGEAVIKVVNSSHNIFRNIGSYCSQFNGIDCGFWHCNQYGYFSSNSSNNTLDGLTTYGVDTAVLLSNSNHTVVNGSDTTATYGIGIILNGTSSFNIFANSTYDGCYGAMSISSASINNSFYNNVFFTQSGQYFNSTAGVNNSFNTTENFGENILGGNITGGNCWAGSRTDNNEGGYYDTLDGYCFNCTDVEVDGICDTSFNESNHTDYLPLAYVCIEDWSCSEWSSCVENNQTRDCWDNNGCGTNVSEPAGSHSCEMLLCQGTALFCHDWDFNITCDTQIGCGLDGGCYGSHQPCDSYNQTDCGSQIDCRWNETPSCIGVINCTDMCGDNTECCDYFGCAYMNETCVGLGDCSMFDNEEDCNYFYYGEDGVSEVCHWGFSPENEIPPSLPPSYLTCGSCSTEGVSGQWVILAQVGCLLSLLFCNIVPLLTLLGVAALVIAFMYKFGYAVQEKLED